MTVVNLKLVDNTVIKKKQRITLIASGKGGVGRTWFSIALAHALSQHGQKVLLFDGDLDMANVDIQLGIMPRLDIGHYFQNQVSLHETICGFEDGGFDVIAGRSGSSDIGDLPELLIDALAADVREVANNYDHMIIDSSSGISGLSKCFAHVADKCLMVLTCEPTSIINAYTFVKALNFINRNLDFEMVVNQSDSEIEAEQTHLVLNNICQKFLDVDLKLLGVIKTDQSIKASIQNQTIHSLRNPSSPALQSVFELSRNLN